jgi:hypothetical protein
MRVEPSSIMSCALATSSITFNPLFIEQRGTSALYYDKVRQTTQTLSET